MKNFLKSYYSSKYYYFLLLPIALLMFPHKGIVHDTRLYVFDILNIAQDGIFANDVLAIVGTQDKYTLFAYLVAPLYKILSPWAATSVVFIVGQIVWFSGIFSLVGKIAGTQKVAFYALLSAFLLPTQYFGFSVLSYGEGFATPRLFVEGLTFWSLWCFFNRRYLISALLVLAAISLHPIMGLIIAALLVATLLQEGRRWWWIFGSLSVAGAVVILAGGAVPLERLTAVLQGDWLLVVQERAKYLYVGEWRNKDWARIIMAVSLTVPLIVICAGWQRRLVIAAWVVGASGLLVSFIGTDLMHNVLVSQVQASRAVWFTYLLGNIGLGIVIAHMYGKSEEDGDVFFFLYILAWTVTHLVLPVPGMILGVIASGLTFLRLRGNIAGIPSIFRRLIYILSALLFAWLIYLRVTVWLKPDALADVFAKSDSFLGLAGFTQIELAIVVFVIFAIIRLRVNVPASLTKGLLVLLALWSIFVWDRRSANDRGLEGDYAADTLREHIPEGAQVYWEGNVKGPWLLLRRPSYFSDSQGAGAVFSEALAAEYLKRSRVVAALDDVDYVRIWRPFKTREEYQERLIAKKELRRDDLVNVCTIDAELDFMMLTRAVDGAYVMVWQPWTPPQLAEAQSKAADMTPAYSLYLYRCADFR